jgi:hypothetical protein
MRDLRSALAQYRFSSLAITTCDVSLSGSRCLLASAARRYETRVGDNSSHSLAGHVGYALKGGFMNTNDIILTIDAEISRLQQAKALLTQTSSPTPAKRKPGRPTAGSGSNKATSFNPADFDAKATKRRGMSAAGRARIAAAQKARWARSKTAAK